MLDSTLGSTVFEEDDEQVFSDNFFFAHPRYVDLGPISSGAFGDVRRVVDKRWQRATAMKITRKCISQTLHYHERFMMEVDIMNSLTHVGILPVYDFGEFDDGRLWFTMPEVQGRTFALVLDELHTLGVTDVFRSDVFRRALESLAQFCEIANFAHTRRIVHRDLKPKNMMVADDVETFVIDWGVAKLLPADSHTTEGQTQLLARYARTKPGEILGTPAYMPPEQAFGDISLQSPASDIYSLGAVLFHLLAGQPPYRGTRPAILAQIKRSAPRSIMTVVGPNRNPPKELIALCEAAMQRSPSKRISKAIGLSHAIWEWLDKSNSFGS